MMIVPQPVSFQTSCRTTSGLKKPGFVMMLIVLVPAIAEELVDEARASEDLLPEAMIITQLMKCGR